MLVTRNKMPPSCRVGMNSLPKKGMSAIDAVSNISAPENTFFLFSRAQSSTGR